MNDACRGFFERLKAYLKEKGAESENVSFYCKEIRSAFRLIPSSIGRYLYELERMGYIKITRGNRYKGFEYKVQSWNDLESLQQSSRMLVSSILKNIKSVSRNPTVTQRSNGLLKVQKDSRKAAVTQGK